MSTCPRLVPLRNDCTSVHVIDRSSTSSSSPLSTIWSVPSSTSPPRCPPSPGRPPLVVDALGPSPPLVHGRRHGSIRLRARKRRDDETNRRRVRHRRRNERRRRRGATRGRRGSGRRGDGRRGGRGWRTVRRGNSGRGGRRRRRGVPRKPGVAVPRRWRPHMRCPWRGSGGSEVSIHGHRAKEGIL
jgi:hypothetical protein